MCLQRNKKLRYLFFCWSFLLCFFLHLVGIYLFFGHFLLGFFLCLVAGSIPRSGQHVGKCAPHSAPLHINSISSVVLGDVNVTNAVFFCLVLSFFFFSVCFFLVLVCCGIYAVLWYAWCCCGVSTLVSLQAGYKFHQLFTTRRD